MTNALFQNHFGGNPTHEASAHGRVNLIGDHTDYNGGLVLPCQLNHQTTVYMARRDDALINAVSDKFGAMARDIQAPCDGSWLDFISGALHMMDETGAAVGGLDLLVTSDVPAGAGVSSSAALEIALLRGMIRVFGCAAIDPVKLARMAQRIEHEFIGTHCGIMDQMVSSAATPGRAMMLDCKTLSFSLDPLFPTASFMVMHSGSSRKLSDGLYNTRLAECRNAASLMSVETLCDADQQLVSALTDPLLQRRARHVIAENQRVRDAADCLQRQDITAFGDLMRASHASLRDDYEVSSPELDKLVTAFINSGAYGARLTGAGFGGCVVALCDTDKVSNIDQAVREICPDAFLVDVVGQA